MKEITIRAANDVGALADVAELLGSLGVNIDAISAQGAGEHAVFRIITNDAATAMKHLARLPGVKASESDILVIDMANRAGELGKITRKLANKGVDLESVYIVSRLANTTQVAIRPSAASFAKAKEALGVK